MGENMVRMEFPTFRLKTPAGVLGIYRESVRLFLRRRILWVFPAFLTLVVAFNLICSRLEILRPVYTYRAFSTTTGYQPKDVDVLDSEIGQIARSYSLPDFRPASWFVSFSLGRALSPIRPVQMAMNVFLYANMSFIFLIVITILAATIYDSPRRFRRLEMPICVLIVTTILFTFYLNFSHSHNIALMQSIMADSDKMIAYASLQTLLYFICRAVPHAALLTSLILVIHYCLHKRQMHRVGFRIDFSKNFERIFLLIAAYYIAGVMLISPYYFLRHLSKTTGLLLDERKLSAYYRICMNLWQVIVIFLFFTAFIIVSARLPFIAALKENIRFWRKRPIEIVWFLLITLIITFLALVVTTVIFNIFEFNVRYSDEVPRFLRMKKLVIVLIVQFVMASWSVIAAIAAMKFYIRYSGEGAVKV